MSTNLLELLKKHLTPDVVSNLAALIGESPQNTETALNTALPSLFVGLVNKSDNLQSLSGLINMLNEGGHDGGVLSNLGALSLGGDETRKLMTEGGNLLTPLFGDMVSGINDRVTTASGISHASSSSLLNFVTPLVMGLIGKSLTLEHIDDATGLAGLLSEQSGFLKSFTPEHAGFSAKPAHEPAGNVATGHVAESTPMPVNTDSQAQTPVDDAATSYFSETTAAISETVRHFGDKIEDATEDAVSYIKDVASDISKSVSDAANSVEESAESLVDDAPSYFEEKAQAATETMGQIVDKVEDVAEAALADGKRIAEGIGETASQFGSHIADESKEFAHSAAEVFDEGAGEGKKFLPWLLLGAALLLVFGLLKSCSTPETAPDTTVTEAPAVSPPPVATTPPAEPVVAAPPAQPEPPVAAPEPEQKPEPAKVEEPVAGKAAESSGDFFEKTLSTGYAIKAAKGGFESKLLNYIESDEVISKDLWFTMTDILFDTNKASIKKESATQISHVAEIMKAYPKVSIKVGGYTDNTGKAIANKTLSNHRAIAVKKAITKAGVEASRIDAEGYGSDHPVASNDTEEGRQQNRRIDVRVTAK
jgi:OmpA-OmpF porin, OOP family